MLRYVFAASALALAACSVDPAFQKVDALSADRTGYHVRWNQNTAEDQQAQAAVHELLAHDLTPESAAQIALLNNPSLQATFEQIGIAQADLMQAGLLHNPQFAASWRFPDRAPSGTDAEYSISQNFLELLTLALRKKIAAAELEQTQLTVAAAVVNLVAETKSAVYRVQAQQQLIERLALILDINQTAADLAARQLAAGTINDLDLANQQSLLDQSKIDLAEAQIELADSREKLTRLLGLSTAEFKVAPHLPDIPTAEIAADNLEPLALQNRLDLLAKKQSLQSLSLAANLTKDFRYLANLSLGIDTERNPDRSNVTGPTLSLEIPIFDQGQARVGKVQAQYRQARDEFLQAAVEIRSEVRAARDRMLAQRTLATLYQKTILPNRIKILQLTQLHYNGMLKGTYDLLLAKQSELAAEHGSIQAARDYWLARTELERALGGKLPSPAASTQPATGEHP